KAGKADYLALMGDELGCISLLLRPGADLDRLIAAGPCTLARSLSTAFGSAHRRHELVAVEHSGAVGRHHLAIAHNHDAVGIVEDFAEQMRDEHAACP